jgi:hypothetical protein
MSPYDAIFMALLASRCLNRPERWWLVVLAPLVACIVGNYQPLGRLADPLTALLAVALAPRWAPVALLLVIPEYNSLSHSLGTALTWLLLDTLLDSLLARLREDAITPWLRGWPIQLLVIGILYYTLLPLVWL